MNQKPAISLDHKPLLYVLILYLPLGFGIAVIHELGHVSVCASAGYDYRIWFDVTGGHMICSEEPGNQFLYNAMGGLVGLIAASAVTAPYLFKRHNITKALVIVGLSYVVLQITNLVLETFYTADYSSHAFDIEIMAVHSFALFMLAIVLNLKVIRPTAQNRQ